MRSLACAGLLLDSTVVVYTKRAIPLHLSGVYTAVSERTALKEKVVAQLRQGKLGYPASLHPGPCSLSSTALYDFKFAELCLSSFTLLATPAHERMAFFAPTEGCPEAVIREKAREVIASRLASVHHLDEVIQATREILPVSVAQRCEWQHLSAVEPSLSRRCPCMSLICLCTPSASLTVQRLRHHRLCPAPQGPQRCGMHPESAGQD